MVAFLLIASSNPAIERTNLGPCQIIIARPEKRSGDLLLIAHGLRPVSAPLSGDFDVNGVLETALLKKGWTIAKTSYRRNGYLMDEAVQDLDELYRYLEQKDGRPKHVYLLGWSMGGGIAAKLAERPKGWCDGTVAVGAALPNSLTYKPTIPLLFLTNRSELEGPTRYTEKAQESVVWKVERDGHCNVNDLEALSALTAIEARVKRGKKLIARNGTIEMKPPRSQAVFESLSATTPLRGIDSVWGTLQTSFTRADLDKLKLKQGDRVQVRLEDQVVMVSLCNSYWDVEPGEWGALVEPSGYLEIGQNGGSQFFKDKPGTLITLTPLPSLDSKSSKFFGNWGYSQECQLGLSIGVYQDGTLRVRVTSPGENIGAYWAKNVELKDGQLSFYLPLARSKVFARMNPMGNLLLRMEREDDYEQWFNRSDLLIGAGTRPQEPEPPYPYRTEDVAITSPKGTLAGTLSLPKGKGPFPSLILLNGSRYQDRDYTIGGHKPFLVLADRLTKLGYAVLRTDDRGFAESTGEADYTLDDRVAEGNAQIAYLLTRKEISPRRIGLLGHSEGALVAPMIAADSKQVAFQILIGAPTLPGRQMILEMRLANDRALGVAPEISTAYQKEFGTFLDYWYEHREDVDLKDKLSRWLEVAIRDPQKLHALAAVAQEAKDAKVNIEELSQLCSSPYYRQFLAFNPTELFKRTKIPTLAIYGQYDIQTPPAVCAPLLRQANPKLLTLQILERVNHNMQPASSGNPKLALLIDTTISENLWSAIAAWLGERAQKRK